MNSTVQIITGLLILVFIVGGQLQDKMPPTWITVIGGAVGTGLIAAGIARKEQ